MLLLLIVIVFVLDVVVFIFLFTHFCLFVCKEERKEGGKKKMHVFTPGKYGHQGWEEQGAPGGTGKVKQRILRSLIAQWFITFPSIHSSSFSSSSSAII